MLRLLIAGLALSGCVKFVNTQPRTVLFAGQDEDSVRAILIRSIDQRRIVARKDEGGVLVGDSDRAGVPCTFTITWTDQQAVVASAGPSAADDATKIDARCDELGAKLVKTIQGEVTRPERMARKEEKRRRKEDELAARNQAYAAWAAQQQAQQPVAQPTPVPPPAPVSVAPPPQPARAEAPRRNEPPPPPPRRTSSYPTGTTTTITRQNAAPPPAPAGPTLQPNTCCVARRAYLCPNTLAYAAECVQKTVALGSTCPAAPAHDRFCP